MAENSITRTVPVGSGVRDNRCCCLIHTTSNGLTRNKGDHTVRYCSALCLQSLYWRKMAGVLLGQLAQLANDIMALHWTRLTFRDSKRRRTC
jgi:hypothetical protein